MDAQTGCRLLALFIVLTVTRATAACVDPAQLEHSTVSIMRHFDEAEHGTRPDLIGIRGTGWFLSPTTIVTAAHVAEAMKLSIQDWKPLEIADRDGSQFVAVRIQGLAGNLAEKLAVLELQRAVSAARTLAIRREPLVPQEQVMTYVFAAGPPHYVRGSLFDSETTSLRAPRSWKYMRATIALSWITAPRELRWSIVTAASSQSSATCSPRACGGRPAKYEFRLRGETPTLSPCQSRH